MPDQPELRERVAEAIAQAIDDPAIGVGFTDGLPWGLHLADVLLSLPGIAIVQLPEPVGSYNCGLCFSLDVMTYKGRVIVGTEFDVSTDYARDLAAALLAAAEAVDAAEAQTNA